MGRLYIYYGGSKHRMMKSRRKRRYWLAGALLVVLILMSILLTASDTFKATGSARQKNITSLQSASGLITYSSNAQDVLIRTFYGGGNLGVLNFSPEISIYGDGSYILGPGLTMREGKLGSTALQQLLHTLVDTYGLLNFQQRQFYDVPDQNATFLQLMLNGKYYEFLYGQFGAVQESSQELDEYQRLGKVLTSITEALTGPTYPYTSNSMALLVHQDFSPDFSRDIPSWSFPDFTLNQLAIYECGSIPPDETGPNADTGCLSFTIPRNALLLSAKQLQQIRSVLNGQQQGEFEERGLYYTVILRPLLPDEVWQKTLAMLGSQQLSYVGVPLRVGPVPIPTPTG